MGGPGVPPLCQRNRRQAHPEQERSTVPMSFSKGEGRFLVHEEYVSTSYGVISVCQDAAECLLHISLNPYGYPVSQKKQVHLCVAKEFAQGHTHQ